MVVALTMVDRPIPVALVEMAAAVLEALDMEVQAQQELQTLAAVLAVVVIMK